MTLEPLLAPFTEKGKQVSTRSFGMILELKTETGRAAGDQWGAVLQLVPLAQVLLHLATGRCLPEVLQPMCSAENHVHSHGDVGLQSEMMGSLRSRRIMAPEEKPDRSRRVGCGVRLEWVGWKERPGLETGSLIRLGRDPGAPKGAKWAFEEDCPGFR